MSTSTISKAEESSRMKELDDTFEDKYLNLIYFFEFFLFKYILFSYFV